MAIFCLVHLENYAETEKWLSDAEVLAVLIKNCVKRHVKDNLTKIKLSI